ncbi:MAG: hypothetical protein LBK95_15085 [Bifidobacteriaceae bacterium]|nr:hypothetical protein [Bifidobacteriaceae bacterium]
MTVRVGPVSAWTNRRFEIVDGGVLAELRGPNKTDRLELTFAGDTAAGTLAFSDDLHGDLGTGDATLTAVPTS